MKTGRLWFFAVVLIFLHCAAPLTRFYPGSYSEQSRTYTNKHLGFSLTFSGVWRLTCDPALMEGASRGLARSLSKTGAELLFMGSTAEATQGVRAIVINRNFENQEYADKIHELNKNDIQQDSGFSVFSAPHVPCIKWRYAMAGFEFVEYFFKLDTYNMRLAFWANPDLFQSFLPVYDRIAGSLSYESRD